RSGTLGEFSIAYDEGKLIGVLQGTGGIADTLPEIVKNIEKDTGASLIYESDPVQLVEKLLAIYEQRHYRHPSCFCEPAVV
ncbi:MAG: protein containing YHS domain protein, partial [Gammaproteobacteria bacterium]